ncbi:hypothetical protein [Streptomyces sanglieri]|uniref:hypothetical protein n=1 Tax=Streptomyces sanglieri TaxID=193460 RepID=UPI003524C948
MLETANDAQMAWSVYFVYGDREHIRFLLRNIFVENDDPDMVDAHFDQTADLWLIESGRRVGHVDLHSLISIPDDAGTRRVLVDWVRFDELVPAFLTGSVLHHGEELRLLAARDDFADTQSNLPLLYPDTPIGYGMQVWVDGDLTDQPYEIYPDPDPAESG